MSVSFTTTEQRGAYSWYFAWESTLEDPTYYIYIDGLLAAITTEPWFQLDVSEGMVAFEVLDDADALPADVFPGQVLLSWDTSGEVGIYTVEEYVDSEWVARATMHSTGQNTLSFTTRYLEDDTTHQFRLTPQDESSQIDGTERNITFLMVRKPDVPDVTYSLDDETGVVTIS